MWRGAVIAMRLVFEKVNSARGSGAGVSFVGVLGPALACSKLTVTAATTRVPWRQLPSRCRLRRARHERQRGVVAKRVVNEEADETVFWFETASAGLTSSKAVAHIARNPTKAQPVPTSHICCGSTLRRLILRPFDRDISIATSPHRNIAT